ncbi:MAG: ImmA/IrrE family metallo-endopeptidase [Erysipelotrichaceae bacterium]|nr:ImmA/IrrE family metallo-endopeptidase [Erysipelotrichaceae bacterium]
MKSLQELNSLALRTRRLLGEDSYSPIDIFALVNGWKEKKITIVRYPFSNRISGMCTCINNDFIIGINSKSSYGRQRFTLAHELYHILYERNTDRVICDMSMVDTKSDSEKEADWFASYLLMPYDALLAYDEKAEEWNLERVIEAEQFFQISHMAMVFRLKQDGKITADEASVFQSCSVSRKAASLGFGKELYIPLPVEKQYFTTGEYIRKVEQLSEKDLISNGKREELLLDAFRADIVYNLDEEEGFHLND